MSEILLPCMPTFSPLADETLKTCLFFVARISKGREWTSHFSQNNNNEKEIASFSSDLHLCHRLGYVVLSSFGVLFAPSRQLFTRVHVDITKFLCWHRRAQLYETTSMIEMVFVCRKWSGTNLRQHILVQSDSGAGIVSSRARVIAL